MLIGEYKHSLDPKKRLSIPAKLRREIGQKAILTRGLDNCLFMFPVVQWRELAVKLGNLPFGQHDNRAFVRLMLSGASEVEIDRLGRILIPEYLMIYASLKRDIVVAGLYNRLEIWNETAWSRYTVELEKNSDAIAEKLGQLGVI